MVKQLLNDYKDRKQKSIELAGKYLLMVEYEQKERAEEIKQEISLCSQELNQIAKMFIEEFID